MVFRCFVPFQLSVTDADAAESFSPTKNIWHPGTFVVFGCFVRLQLSVTEFPKFTAPLTNLLCLPQLFCSCQTKYILNSNDSAQNVLKWKKYPCFSERACFDWSILALISVDFFFQTWISFNMIQTTTQNYVLLPQKLQLFNVAFHIEKISKTLSQIWYTHHMSSAVVKCDTMERYIRPLSDPLVWPRPPRMAHIISSFHCFS